MSKFFISIIRMIICFILLSITWIPVNCQKSDATAVTLSASGWTMTADPIQGHLTLYHDSLGILLKEVTFNIKIKKELKPLTKWTAEKKGVKQLSIKTTLPTSVWIFELNQNNVIISATSSDLVLTAVAPASSERIVSRLLDPSGVPVNWTGTSEITVSWKGKETINPSNFPSKNPEVMTFGLGQVSASNLHSLFDRKSDIGVVFSESTVMERDRHNGDLLKITMPVPGNTIIRLKPDYYTTTLGLPSYKRFDDSQFPSAPLIWGSWTAYYYEARETDIVSNADWLSANLKPYGFQYVQIDDGYDRGKEEGHYWIENWNKALFPHGPEWIAGYIKSKGLRPGIWLVPNSYAGAYEKHPDWYIYDKSGKVIQDYKTPALDYTNPSVQEWLKKLFTTLKGWGFEYYKFDGELYLPLYSPDVDQSKIFDKSIDPLVAYRSRLKLIRDVIGPETFVEGCVAGSPLNGIGFFNSVFNGADMYNSWKGCYAVFSSINANAFLNHMVTYVMPGEGIDVSPLMSAEEAIQKMTPRAIAVVKSREDPFTGFGTTIAEARTLVSHVSLSGVAYPLTSIMPDLPEERVKLLKVTMPTLPILPVDLYGRGGDLEWTTFKEYTPDTYIHNYPEILDLKVNAKSGIYDVAAFTNWRSESVSKEISFSDKLGINSGTPLVVFDFWNQKLLGAYRDKMEIDIDPHDTRVLLIHPMQGHPQLIANSRHISGVQSILDLKWNDSAGSLSGTSETIENDIYSLFVYIPEGMVMSMASALTSDDHELKVTSELDGNLLKMSFPGQQATVKWQVRFSGRPGHQRP